MNTGKIREAKAALDKNNVPPDNCCLLMHTNSLKELLEQTTVQSADFNTIRALVDGAWEPGWALPSDNGARRLDHRRIERPRRLCVPQGRARYGR